METLFKQILRIFLRLRGYKFHLVQSKEEQNKVNAFAKAILTEEAYPENYLKLLDRYDDNAETFAIYHKKRLIGSMRLISPEGPCRILDFWNVKFPDDTEASKSREMGSLVIDKRYRGKSRWPIIALLDIAYEYSQKQGIKWWFASALQDKFEKFKTMNPSCSIMETSEPTEHQLNYRTQYPEYFYEYEAPVIFIFNLSGASYTYQFKRILYKKLGLKKSVDKSATMIYSK